MRRSRIVITVVCATAIAASTMSVTAATAGAARDPWKELLARVPASGSFGHQVILNDYEAARAAADIERTGDRVHDLFALEQASGIAPSELLRTRGPDPLDREVGIKSRGVRRDVTAGDPPDDLVILEGSVDADRVQKAVENDDTFSDLLETKKHGGSEYYSWGPNKIDLKRRTPLRPLGVGGDLAIDPPFATFSDSAKSVEQSIDAASGNVKSLTDDRDLMAALDALRSTGVYSAFLTDAEVAPGASTGGPTSLAPYEAVAAGPALDGKTHLLVVALTYADAATARTQADRLQSIAEDGTSVTRAPWSDLVTVDTVTTKGRVVLGTFTTERARLWLDIVLRRDSLLATA